MPAVYSAAAYRHACSVAGVTQRELASRLGIAESTLSRKAVNGNFTRNEIAIITEVLHLDNPGEIFFIQK